MAPDRARCRAGRIDEDRVEELSRLPRSDIGDDRLGGELQALEIGFEARHALRRLIDGDDPGPGRGKLRGLASRRGAEIGDVEAANIAENFCGQRGGGILHPPGALGKTREILDPATRRQANASRRQEACRRAFPPRASASCFTERSSAASCSEARAMRRAKSSPYALRQRSNIQAGILRTSLSRLERMSPPFSETRRNTAFASRSKRLALRSARHWSTASEMAACGGVLRMSNCAAAASRMISSLPMSLGSGFSRNFPMTAESAPRLRNTALAMARAKARSRGFEHELRGGFGQCVVEGARELQHCGNSVDGGIARALARGGRLLVFRRTMMRSGTPDADRTWSNEKALRPVLRLSRKALMGKLRGK